MYEVFADLHVHIGRSENGKPIKITAARSLNFANIAKECAERKGINIVGIIDCASPYVIEDIEKFLQTGEAYELKDKLKTETAIEGSDEEVLVQQNNNESISEAGQALQILGYNKGEIAKVFDKIETHNLTTEELIKEALKHLAR